MKSLNDKANGRLMRLIDQMAGQSELCVTSSGQQPLTLTLLATDIFSTSVNTVGNLYKLSFSDSPDGKTENPAMNFLVIDRRLENCNDDAIQIFPVSYRHDTLKEDITIVSIVNGQVLTINNNLQIKYVRFANQWLKMLDHLGYVKEQAERVGNEQRLVCICGNNIEIDGFDFCNAAGNLTARHDPIPDYCTCRSCNRIIKLDTLEVVGKVNKAASAVLTLDIFKPIINMSDAEKAKLLHVLCPDVMRGFLTYVNDKAQEIIESDELTMQSSFTESLSLPAWKELAKNASQIISTSINRLVNDSDLFAKDLFVNSTKVFLMHCIQEYMNHCQNARFIRGIEFIFDL